MRRQQEKTFLRYARGAVVPRMPTEGDVSSVQIADFGLAKSMVASGGGGSPSYRGGGPSSSAVRAARLSLLNLCGPFPTSLAMPQMPMLIIAA